MALTIRCSHCGDFVEIVSISNDADSIIRITPCKCQYEAGAAEAFARGKENGYDIGRTDGYGQGRDAGYADGHKDAMAQKSVNIPDQVSKAA